MRPRNQQVVEAVTNRGEMAELRGGASGRPVGGGGELTELGVGHGAWRSGQSAGPSGRPQGLGGASGRGGLNK